MTAPGWNHRRIDAADDARFMARALQLARRGLFTTDPNPRVGCVVVNDNRIVGEGWHVRAGEPHAEVLALKQAGSAARGAAVYVTLEPCCHQGRTPPCTPTLIAAGVKRVVAAMRDPNPKVCGKGFEDLQRHGIAFEVGLMQDAAATLNPGFISRMQRGRPYVRLKVAASLDGKTALADGQSRWITGEAARADGQKWRARSSAIVTGIGTVLSDDPALTVRGMDIGRQPLRVVVDSRLRMSPEAQLLRLPGATLLVTAERDDARAKVLEEAGAEITVLPGDGGVDLGGLMSFLGAREVNEVLVEAGATLNGALAQAQLVDELVIYFAPHLLGDTARGMFQLPAIADMAARTSLQIIDVRKIGDDWRMIAKVTPN